MKFNYRFQKILDIKDKLEEHKKMEINNIISNINELENEISSLEENKKGKYYEMKDVMDQGTSIGNVRRMNHMLSSFDVKVKSLTNRNDDLKEKLELNKMQYREILKEKKVFEKIKEKDYLVHNDMIKKEEEKFLDQIVTFKFKASN